MRDRDNSNAGGGTRSSARLATLSCSGSDTGLITAVSALNELGVGRTGGVVAVGIVEDGLPPKRDNRVCLRSLEVLVGWSKAEGVDCGADGSGRRASVLFDKVDSEG